jgi:glycosyltransferase involved in cell wall biosynthesis
MKIAILSSGFLPVIDGVTVAQFNRLQKLSQWGHEVLLLCPDYEPIEAIYPNWRDFTGNILPGVKVVNLASTPYMGIEFERNVSPKSYDRALQELAAFQPDIIHVDEAERLANGFFKFPGVAFAKQANIPCVSFFHTNFVEYAEDFIEVPAPVMKAIQFVLKKLFAWVYNAYDMTLVGSSDAYKKIKQMGIRNGRKGDFLGIDQTKYQLTRDPNFFAEKYGWINLSDKVKLVFLGRLTPDKGWKFTISALQQMAQTYDLGNVAILIAGDGEMATEIADRLHNLTVHFLGRIPPEDVPALLVNSDIHVTTSEKETRGLTILEAFAANIPAIAPRAGGVTDSIQDGGNGFLFVPGNAQDFAEKLHRLIQNPNLRREMGAKGRASVNHYGWDEMVGNLLQVWEEAISVSGGSANARRT